MAPHACFLPYSLRASFTDERAVGAISAQRLVAQQASCLALSAIIVIIMAVCIHMRSTATPLTMPVSMM